MPTDPNSSDDKYQQTDSATHKVGVGKTTKMIEEMAEAFDDGELRLIDPKGDGSHNSG